MALLKNILGRAASGGDWSDLEIEGTIAEFNKEKLRGALDGFSIFHRNGLGRGAPGLLRIELEPVRICIDCAVPKPIEEFPIKTQVGRIPPNRNKTCKACWSKKMTQRYHRLAGEGKFESRKSQRRGTGCTLVPTPPATKTRAIFTRTIKHGRSRYEKRGCRCEVCVKTTRAFYRKRYHRRKDANQ